MLADDTAKGEHIEDEQGERGEQRMNRMNRVGPEHRALSDTTGDVVCQGFSLSQGNMLSSPGEVG